MEDLTRKWYTVLTCEKLQMGRRAPRKKHLHQILGTTTPMGHTCSKAIYIVNQSMALHSYTMASWLKLLHPGPPRLRLTTSGDGHLVTVYYILIPVIGARAISSTWPQQLGVVSPWQ